MRPLSPRWFALAYLATALSGFALFRVEQFGFPMIGLFALVPSIAKPLFAMLDGGSSAVSVLYFFVLLFGILLVALYGWSSLAAMVLAVKDALAPAFLPKLSRATPYLVAVMAGLSLIGLSTAALFPGEQPEKLRPSPLWCLVPVVLLAIAACDLRTRQCGDAWRMLENRK